MDSGCGVACDEEGKLTRCSVRSKGVWRLQPHLSGPDVSVGVVSVRY